MQNTCYHCGEDLKGSKIRQDEHTFCCRGCQMVYTLLSENGLDGYYNIERQPGTRPADEIKDKYTYLDMDTVRMRMVDFTDDNSTRITLFLPQIHCASCIYLLEHLHRLNPDILSVQVNFTRREAVIHFNHQALKLSELALLLEKIGYAPSFTSAGQVQKSIDKTLFYKLGVAGFAFGSIMLWSFPEYMGIDGDNPAFRNFTAYLTFAVSLPVLFYSASDYFISAYKALKYKSLNLDVPITIGIIVLYLKSAISIFQLEGPGYMDSFAGFIFFLLIGKWFQGKTYRALSFERDYTSYFPVAVLKITGTGEHYTEIDQLVPGDLIRIRNEEIIPCDSEIYSGEGHIDYSFVTGESVPVSKIAGDMIYAGGKQTGSAITLKVLKASSRSHLTQLWDSSSKKHRQTRSLATQDKVSRYFMVIIFIIASISALGWAFFAPGRIMEIVTAILIVACPCALALSVPFTFGNIMRSLGRHGMYLRNIAVIEALNTCTDIIFDKTGTLTTGSAGRITYQGEILTDTQQRAIFEATRSSTHPLSQSIHRFLAEKQTGNLGEAENFQEISGKGISATWNGITFMLGSKTFLGIPETISGDSETAVHLLWNGTYTGSFIFSTELRPEIETLGKALSKNYKIHVISGDNQQDSAMLHEVFPPGTQIHFNQSPVDKRDYIRSLKKAGKKTLMVGDGLNDSGALMESHAGIAISENIFRFTPASDAIIEAASLKDLDKLLKRSAYAKTILKVCLVFSLSYNIVGLSFAISGYLTPLVAAILMPLSSITVVLLSTLLVSKKR